MIEHSQVPVVLVTGGASGIGWAVCRRFAAAGYRVAVIDRDGEAAKAQAQLLGGDSIGIACDVSQAEQIAAAVAACAERYSRIDVLVNNAGIVEAAGETFVDKTLAGFRSLFAVNLLGMHAAAQAVAPLMRAQGGGAIVNLASCAGVVATPYQTGYGATKSAIMAMTRALADVWSADGIRVCAVAPGYVRTELMDGLIARGAVDPAVIERRIPLGRMGRPEELAEAIFYLGRGEADGVAGATLLVDGGLLAFGGSGAASTGPAPASRLPAAGASRVVLVQSEIDAGGALAARFAAGGDRVVVFGDDPQGPARVASALGPQHLYCAGATTDQAAVLRMVARVGQSFGAIDVVVNDLRVAAPGAAFETEIDRALAGSFVVLQAVAPLMFGKGGAIVNICGGTQDAGIAQRVGPAVAAGGIALLTRGLACEWAPQGVRVNAIVPAATPMEDDIAALAGFLTSEAASYITGAVVPLSLRLL
jgi:NAD(P)-dependent dehydrogenase (short-subunit alcohol dehydrogenase family)